MKYYIFRHAETYFTKKDLSYGDQIKTAPILKEGIPVVTKLAKYLKDKKTDANFSSPFLRCKQTVEIVKNVSGKKFVFDKRLKEFDSETVEEMVARIDEFLKETEKNNYKSIAICTHGWPIAVLRNLIIDKLFDQNKINDYPNPGILMEIEKGKVKLIDFN